MARGSRETLAMAPHMPALTPDLPQTEIAIVALTNAFRRENKLGEVRPNAALAKAARAFAEYLARTNSFSHSADGRQPADRIKAAGYAYCDYAENLALNLDSRGFETRALAGQVVEGWKESPGHRKNMLTPHATEIGVGIAKAPDEPRYLSVQIFGRPQSEIYSFKIANRTERDVNYEFLSKPYQIKSNYTITHTVCIPGALQIEGAGGTSVKAATGRFEASSGRVFTLRPEKGGRVKVEVSSEPAK